ncbi:MAG: hypothetical protein KDB11_12380 [Planctomycetales bacterium]|nr:hypothetical protein [Planctomycetales bacterium]
MNSQSLKRGAAHSVSFHYTDQNRNRKTGTANIACPFGLSANDELYLYGLLALTFAQPDPSPEFYATPHWCLRQLGIVDPSREQGKRYQIFRDAIRRLSGVIYENDCFYDPVRGEHRDVAFGFLKYSLPLPTEKGQHSPRAWRFVWDQQFFEFAQSIRGSFTFDFQLYLDLDLANRRLFLLLQKIFWRHEQSPSFELRQLGIDTLGFSDTLATKEIKQKLIRCAEVLLKQDILTLPSDRETVRDRFEKRGKGEHHVRFYRGSFFDETKKQSRSRCDSPLIEPLESIGLDRQTIDRVLRDYKAGMIQQWADVTLAAIERKVVSKSPQAYFMHHIKEAKAKRTTPPDWWRDLQQKEYRKQYEERDRTQEGNDDAAFDEYLRCEGREAFERVMDRLFVSLRASGQEEDEAKRNANYMARVNLRGRFYQQASGRSDSGFHSVSDTLRRRNDS